MKKIALSLLIGLGMINANAIPLGSKKEVKLEDLKKIVQGNATRTFSKSNVYAYPKYKDTINKYKNSDETGLGADVKDQIALAKREKAEADGEVPGWNKALAEVDKFVQHNGGSKKSDDYQELTDAMATIKRESDKLVAAITMANNTFFGGDRSALFGSAKAHEDTKWEFMYIRNNLDTLIKKLEPKTFDTAGKKDAQYILLFTAKYLKASALKASNDMVAEMKKRKSVSA
jgi:hypothetical protein